MRWYDLIIGEENRLPYHFFGDSHELFGRDWLDLLVAVIIDDWDDSSMLRSTEAKCDGLPDDFLGNGRSLPIFSPGLRDALEVEGVGQRDIQYLPVRIARSNGEQVPGFAIANVVEAVLALDREHSTLLDVDPDEIDVRTGKPNVLGVWTPAIIADAVKGHDVIRLAEFLPAILVSERFVEIVNRNKFTGATFKEIPVI